MTAIQNFILVFDRHAGVLVDLIEFGTQVKAAMDKYERLEEKHRTEPHMDIVLVGSDSIDTVKVTHANYFNGKARDVYADVLSLAN